MLIINYYGEANEAFEKVASYGLLPNMIMYLIRDYRFGVAKGTNVLFMWSAATNFTPLLGAFLSDSYLGRFLTIAIASLSSFLVIFNLSSLQFSFCQDSLNRFTLTIFWDGWLILLVSMLKYDGVTWFFLNWN